ncbi:hypothetical protein J6590_000008 [Homalodisca vitripennis]|nr:hypothetical protein J6590_000008 [Homalodisca vitripennis]
MKLVGIFILSVCVCCSHSTLEVKVGSRAVSTLKFLVVVSKHGARAPTHTYPRDPYRNITFWPEGAGQLTKVGKRQMHRVGQKLRHLYHGYLSALYENSKVMIQSTLVDRTMASAATLLAGLYPPQAHQLWNPEIPWQPVPIYPNLLDKALIVSPDTENNVKVLRIGKQIRDKPGLMKIIFYSKADLKTGFLVPIHKSDTRTSMKSYRTIVIQSTMAKMFEKIVLDRQPSSPAGKASSSWCHRPITFLGSKLSGLPVSLVQPVLEFSSVVWSPYQVGQIASFDGVEWQFCRMVGVRQGYQYMDVDLQAMQLLLRLPSRRAMMDTIFLFKLLNGLLTAQILHQIDFLLTLDPTKCPRYWHEQNISQSILQDQYTANHYADIYAAITAGSGVNMSFPSQMFLLFHNLAASTENGLTLPNWAEDIFLPKMLPLVSKMVRDTTMKNVKMIKILNGLFFGKIVEMLQRRLKQQSDKQEGDLNMLLHVGHDITILCLLAAVGLHDSNIPWSSTTLLFELHTNEALQSKHEVKVLKIDGLSNSSNIPEDLEIPFCKSPCDLSTFVSHTEKYTTKDWGRECMDMNSPSDQ